MPGTSYQRNGERLKARLRIRYRTDPEYRRRVLARAQAYRTLRDPRPCERCDSVIDVQRHHDDYARPLDVRWLCRKCHIQRHGSWGAGLARDTGSLDDGE